ncbi:Dual specificity protein kinase splB-like [Oopsacas minuta]|uniref:Dual specificity protein kinase splB-like n=1 Tax=Oopsacas minuta TaxID=111878 RepID=A0AAV7JXH9_9METZ|nr:Dual specificity protein kinase splB-like [Oopsacas minuta]
MITQVEDSRPSPPESCMLYNVRSCLLPNNYPQCSITELAVLSAVPTSELNQSSKSSLAIYESLNFSRDFIVPTFEQRTFRSISDENETEHIYVEVNVDEDTPCFMYDDSRAVSPPVETIKEIFSLMSVRRYREISRIDLVEYTELGRGNFAVVHNGIWKSMKGDIPVAIKSLKMEDEESCLSFLQEASILGQFNHPNVLKLFGVVTRNNPLKMVTELMSSGLLEFLKNILKNNIITFDRFSPYFLRFTLDIANGMEYLARKRYVHRDLSARNILLTQELNCKIGDFGLARMVANDNQYERNVEEYIPFKWTPPEAIFYKKYSEKSDVWSFGVTLFEIWSVGQAPWPHHNIQQVIGKISEGVLLYPPSGCPRGVYQLMTKCWHPDKEFRPCFAEIASILHTKGKTLLERGKTPEEMVDLGLVPSASKKLFIDLQTAYLNSTS